MSFPAAYFFFLPFLPFLPLSPFPLFFFSARIGSWIRPAPGLGSSCTQVAYDRSSGTTSAFSKVLSGHGIRVLAKARFTRSTSDSCKTLCVPEYAEDGRELPTPPPRPLAGESRPPPARVVADDSRAEKGLECGDEKPCNPAASAALPRLRVPSVSS